MSASLGMPARPERDATALHPLAGFASADESARLIRNYRSTAPIIAAAAQAIAPSTLVSGRRMEPARLEPDAPLLHPERDFEGLARLQAKYGLEMDFSSIERLSREHGLGSP